MFFFFFFFLKSIEPVLNELEISENQKKLMNYNDLTEGSTKGKLQHCHFSQRYVKIMLILWHSDHKCLLLTPNDLLYCVETGLVNTSEMGLSLEILLYACACMHMQSLL
jgi:hypothetical protein